MDALSRCGTGNPEMTGAIYAHSFLVCLWNDSCFMATSLLGSKSRNDLAKYVLVVSR